MAVQERQNQILQILDQHKTISVSDLTRMLYASPATVRRDLELLEKKGLLKRVRGGAVSVQCDNFDVPVYLRTSANLKEKEMISRLALKFVRNSATYFFDSSSTCCFLAQKMSTFTDVTVATTGLEILSIMQSYTGVRVISFGGELRKNYGEFASGATMNNVQQYHADTLFMSCRGLSLKAGATETYGMNAAIKQRMLEHANQCVLLCDSSKFDQDFFYKAADLRDIDYVVSDRWPSNSDLIDALNGKLVCPH